MRWKTALGDRMVEVALGFSLALTLVCMGLWREATLPILPGTNPVVGFHTVVSDLGFSPGHRNRVPLRHLETMAAAGSGPELMGTLGSRRVIDLGGRPEEVRFDLVFGPLLPALRVPIVGRPLSERATSLPLSLQPVREAVISMPLAERLFGSAEGALGQRLRIATMQWMLTGDSWAEFEIVGVADRAFLGTRIESPAQLWVGINGWSNVLFPAQQVEDVRRVFGADTLTLRTAAPAEAARQLSETLKALGEPSPRIEMAAGAGYHPARRARFAELSRALMLGVVSLALMLAVCLGAFGLLRAQRARHAERVRQILGERPRRRALRQLGAGLRSLSTVAAAAAATLALATQMETRVFPVSAAVLRGLGDPVGWLLLAGFATALLLLQPAFTVSAARSAPSGARSGNGVAGLLALLLLGVALAWFAGSLGVQRLARLIDTGLPATVLSAQSVAIDSQDRGWMFDPRDTRALESDLASAGIALASSGPVGQTLVNERGVVTSANGERAGIVPINYVTSNYFRVLGLAERGVCGPMASWGEDAIYVNRQFLRAYGSGLDASAHRIRLDDGRLLQVCGEVEDAHVANARAGLSPMTYAPLRERRFLHAAVIADRSAEGRLGRLESALSEAFPDTTLGLPAGVRETLLGHLQQERTIALLNAAMMALSAVLCFFAASMLGRAALRMNLRALATRRALGASRSHLVATALLGRSVLPWLAALSLLAFGLVLAYRLGAVAGEGWTYPLAAAALACLGLALSVGLRLLTGVSDRSLLGALKAE